MNDQRIEVVPGITLVVDTDRVTINGYTETVLCPGLWAINLEFKAQGLSVRTGGATVETVFNAVLNIPERDVHD